MQAQENKFAEPTLALCDVTFPYLPLNIQGLLHPSVYRVCSTPQHTGFAPPLSVQGLLHPSAYRVCSTPQHTGFAPPLSIQDLLHPSAYRVCPTPQHTGFAPPLSIQDLLHPSAYRVCSTPQHTGFAPPRVCSTPQHTGFAPPCILHPCRVCEGCPSLSTVGAGIGWKIQTELQVILGDCCSVRESRCLGVSIDTEPPHSLLCVHVVCRDMVKRLINKMNFDALEVKMKKCKVII